jgi:ribosomal 50S subunit-recycling heat shock protein
MVAVRLDKYLQVTRLVRRRTLAQEAVRAGRVRVAGREAKPGTELKAGDVIELALGRRRLTIRVLAVPERVRVGQEGLYEVVAERVVADEPWT